MSLWQRVRRALGLSPQEPVPPEATPPPLAAPAAAGDPDPQGDNGALFYQRMHKLRGDEAGEVRDLRELAERLVAGGRVERALEILGRLAALPSADDALLLRLSELLCARGETTRAVPMLRRVLASPTPLPRRLRARDLLAGCLLEMRDRDGARDELSAILAEDLDYPGARMRLAQLVPAQATEGRSLLADRLGDGGKVVQALPTLLGVEEARHQRYHLLRELGRGGAGTVYLARDTELSRDLAIKVFYAGLTSAESRVRAWNEARLTAAVRHPGVVAIYDLDAERNLMVMELCQGGTLRQRLQERGRMPAAAALRRTFELLDTLATVHRTGVVHGDLKPGNLLFRYPDSGAGEERQGDLVIADFGTARLYEGAGDQEGHAAGTLGYIPPERRFGPQALLPAADLYAVGVVLLEMLLGSLPLPRAALLRGDPLPIELPEAVAGELGPRKQAVEKVLRLLLCEDPLGRPSAQEARMYMSEIVG